MNSTTENDLLGVCYADIKIKGRTYENMELVVFGNLCAEVLLGGDLLHKHNRVVFEFNSDGKYLTIENNTGSFNALTKVNVKCSSLFASLLPDCKPISTKSRIYNSSDQKFINDEIQRWYSEKVIRTSQSPWRAQVLVVKRADNGDEIIKGCVLIILKRLICIYRMMLILFHE